MIFSLAIQEAISAHSNQKRKLDDTPYVVHPIEVGVLLAKYGCDEDTIVAGILHDTVEDTCLSLDAIEKTFGKRVALLVSYCTEMDKSLDWHSRKKDYLKQLRNAPQEALLIVAADKVSNLSGLLESQSINVWQFFNADYPSQKWYYEAILTTLSPINTHPLYHSLDEIIKELFAT